MIQINEIPNTELLKATVPRAGEKTNTEYDL